MRLSVNRVVRIAAGVAAATLLVIAIPTGAATADSATKIQMLDDCDPATFNQPPGPGPGTCVGDGDTTFNQLIASLIATGSHPKWRFSPSTVKVDPGTVLVGVNKGGEAHSFTEVAKFGGGCVPPLNALLHLDPAPECNNPQAFPGTVVPPGQRITTGKLSPRLHYFQCLIHPWMRVTVDATGCCGGGDCSHCG